jgi:hypothetical protein
MKAALLVEAVLLLRRRRPLLRPLVRRREAEVRLAMVVE